MDEEGSTAPRGSATERKAPESGPPPLPDEAAVLATSDGVVSFGPGVGGKKTVTVTDEDTGQSVDHPVPEDRTVVVVAGEPIRQGDQITEGPSIGESATPYKNEGGSIKRFFKRFFGWALILVALVGGWVLQHYGFAAIREMRQLERIPHVDAIAVVEGEVAMNGIASDEGEMVPGHYTEKRSYYLYWKKEEYVEDDDDGRWVTRASGRKYAKSFMMIDSTGEVSVSLESLITNGHHPELGLDYRRRSGDFRYSEYRLDPGDKVFVFAKAVATEGTPEDSQTPPYQIEFDDEGASFTPILSENSSEQAQRSEQGAEGVMATILSLAAFALASVFLCVLLRVHRLLVFLTLLSILNVVTLFTIGIKMLSSDLNDGRDRLARHAMSATAAVEQQLSLEAGDFAWDGALADFQGQEDQWTRERLIGIRHDYTAAIERNNAILDRFPERYLAPLWGIQREASILEEGEPPPPDSEIHPSPVPEILTLLGGIIALAGAIWGGLTGFRRVKIKRYIENVPTSLSTGLVYGPAEVKGRVALYQGEGHTVTGPLSGAKCCHVRYKVTETRGSGDDRKTVTIEHWTDQVPFLCRDAEGYIRVVPEGAEVQARLAVRRTSGNRTYYEYHLMENEELYILGSAVVEPIEGETLEVADGNNDGFPFVISDRNEHETMLAISRGGLVRMGLGFIGIVMLVTLFFTSTGSYSPSDFLLAALTAPACLVLSTFILMFNDLVFLRNRVKRAHANIEVALKKRMDLIPNLESIAKTYLEHERQLHRDIASLRGILKEKDFSPEEIDTAIRADCAVTDRLLALRENHPDLKGNTLISDLMDRLVRVENEIALMREGYNDSVELYRTGAQRFPEVLLAKTFAFKDADLLRAELEVRQVPQVNMAT
ncbi:MAG: hypothetical protein CBB78_014230 [Roseibacillus sp. TMED18]|nr:MAG: hypothetical protein CBB78_014230 [Roseibacillus sp. TMED18]